MRLRAVAAAMLLAVSCLAAAATALGDADPASDVLLGSQAFYPFSPPVSQSLQNQLQQELTQLKNKGLNLKVAIIASPVDLGALPNMFGKPQTYADFLDREISFNQAQPLLVVMPQGFGISHAVPPSALAGLKVDASGKSDGLTRSAILAVPRIAQAAGKPISAGSTSGGSGSSNVSPVVFIAPAIVVLIGVSFVALRQRRLSAENGGEAEDRD